jgi:hypothetical protein
MAWIFSLDAQTHCSGTECVVELQKVHTIK